MRNLVERIVKKPKYNYSDNDTIVDFVKTWINWKYENPTIDWKPVYGDVNNRGSVEIVRNDVQSIVELITNSCDAYLVQHDDDVDSREELRQHVQDDRVVVEATGDVYGKGEYSLTVTDEGVGVSPSEFEDAFVRDPSIGGIDKAKYDHLYGEFGQGSLASISVSDKGCKFVASASIQQPKQWSWTLTRYNPSKKQYQYLVVNGETPTYNGSVFLNEFGEMTHGTITKVFDVKSKRRPNNITENPFIRKIGQKLPEPITPLVITDRRHDTVKRREWNGMKEELDDSDNTKLQKSVSIQSFGEVNITAFVSDTSFDTEYLTADDRSRLFYNIYGMNYHRETYTTVKNKCNLEHINQNVMIFVDCSNMTDRLSKLFMPSKMSMKENATSATLRNQIYQAIRDWDEIQAIDANNEPNTETQHNQSQRAINGNKFEEVVVDKLRNANIVDNDYNIDRESNVPDHIIEQLTIDNVKPDLDVVIYTEDNPVAIVSCKKSTRERVSQTLFWAQYISNHDIDVSVFLATEDNKKELQTGRKWRTLVNEILDGVFMLNGYEYENEENITHLQ